MRTMPLQILTWGTTTAAVVSAAWMTSTDQAALFCSVGYRATSRAMGIEIPLDSQPVRSVAPSRLPGPADAKPQLQASAG